MTAKRALLMVFGLVVIGIVVFVLGLINARRSELIALGSLDETILHDGHNGWWLSKDREHRAEAEVLLGARIPSGWVVDKAFQGPSFNAVVLFRQGGGPNLMLFAHPAGQQQTLESMLRELDRFTEQRLDRAGTSKELREQYLATVGLWVQLAPTATGSTTLPLPQGPLAAQNVVFADDPVWRGGIVGSLPHKGQTWTFILYDRTAPREGAVLVQFLQQLLASQNEK